LDVIKRENPNIKIWESILMVLFLKIPWNWNFSWKWNLFLYHRRNWRGYFNQNVDFLIDGFTKVTDKDAAVYYKKIALKKGSLLKFSRSMCSFCSCKNT
jgi:cystathionine beta-synthase